MRTYIKLFFAGLVIVAGAVVCLITIGRFGERIAVTTEKPSQAAESEKEAVTGEKPDQTIDKEKLIREKLLQAVESAKRGDTGELTLIIDALGRVDVSQELLSDFVSFLQDGNPQIQLLGTHGLYLLKSPESKQVLSEYLKGKDFAKLKERATTGAFDERRAARWEFRASLVVIAALGEIGDESAIPLLESLREVKVLQFELEGGAPVEQALAKLGAVESLLNIPPDADDRRIHNTANAIGKIRHPEKVPELMAVVYNENCAPPIRNSALEAVGKINTVGVPEFLLGVISDSQIPVLMRGTAVITAAQTGNEMFEETLLEIADSNSEIRIEGLCGLTLLKPDKYLKSIFRMIRDEKEPDKFRNTLAARFIIYIPLQQKRQMLEGQKDDLYACLNTNKTDGSPHDEIRVKMWRLINEVFGEEPSIVLSSKSSWGISTLKGIIRHKLQRRRWLSVAEREKRVEEKFKSIVTFSSEDSEAKK